MSRPQLGGRGGWRRWLGRPGHPNVTEGSSGEEGEPETPIQHFITLFIQQVFPQSSLHACV